MTETGPRKQPTATETKAPLWVAAVTAQCRENALVQKLLQIPGVTTEQSDVSLEVLRDRARLWLCICERIAECKEVSARSWWAGMVFLYVPKGSDKGVQYSSPLLKAMIHCCQFAIVVAKSNGKEPTWLHRACAVCNELLIMHARVLKTWTEHGKMQLDKGMPVFWHLDYVTMLTHLMRARAQVDLVQQAKESVADVVMGARIHFAHYNNCRLRVAKTLGAAPLTSDKAFHVQFSALSDGHLFLAFAELARRLASQHLITHSDFCYRACVDGAQTSATELRLWGLSAAPSPKDLLQEHRALLRDNAEVYRDRIDQDVDLSVLPHCDLTSSRVIVAAKGKD